MGNSTGNLAKTVGENTWKRPGQKGPYVTRPGRSLEGKEEKTCEGPNSLPQGLAGKKKRKSEKKEGELGKCKK